MAHVPGTGRCLAVVMVQWGRDVEKMEGKRNKQMIDGEGAECMLVYIQLNCFRKEKIF